MTQLMELYKCKVCENVVEVVHQGVGSLVCCDEQMKLIEEKTPPTFSQTLHLYNSINCVIFSSFANYF